VGKLMREVVGRQKDAPSAAFQERLLEAFALPSGGQALAVARDSLPALIRPVAIPSQESLTPRELELLRLMGDGLSNQTIAERLGVSMSTVKKHINHIMGKLEARDRTQAILRAHQSRLI
jgi:DNA-binding NarL/FixJ family response regulator